MKTVNTKDLWNAEFYKKNSERQFQSAMSIIDNYKFNGNESILDVGCGDGKITAEIAQKIPTGSILGVDISPAMIHCAKESYPNISNLEFQEADITNFSCNRSFDIIFSFATFHWIKNKQDALKNIYLMLKPNGKLIIRMGANRKNEIYNTISSEKWKNLVIKKDTYFGESAKSFTNLLQDAGFSKINVKEVTQPYLYDNSQKLINHFLAWLPHSTGLNNELALELAKDITNAVRLTQNITSPDEKINYESSALIIEAKK